MYYYMTIACQIMQYNNTMSCERKETVTKREIRNDKLNLVSQTYINIDIHIDIVVNQSELQL